METALENRDAQPVVPSRSARSRTSNSNEQRVMPSVERRMLAIRELKVSSYNPRRISSAAMTALEKSVDRFGLVQEIVVNRRGMRVIGGHQRLRVLRAQKVATVPVALVDLDESDEKALNIALNSPAIAGTFSDELQGLLDELAASNKELFDELLFADLRAELDPSSILTGDVNDAPALPKEAISRLGDVWLLGTHRLLCGDACDPASYARLLEGDRVDALVTDPPYGVDYGAKNAMLNARDNGNRIEEPIHNDALAGGYRSWFGSWLCHVPWAARATLFVFMSGQEIHNLRLAVEDCGYACGDYLIWVKNNAVIGRKDYKSRHEFILYGWPKTHRFYGGNSRTTVLEFDRPRKSDLHPTMKPVELCEQLIRDGSPRGGAVLDAFAGSGSVLIACEQAERRCRAIEIDPRYCDVVVERWQTVSGQKARRG